MKYKPYNQMSMDEYNREIARRVRNRRFAMLLNIIQTLLFAATVVLLFALYCAATPDQLSGEADLTESEVAK